jgi:hypothetical protein
MNRHRHLLLLRAVLLILILRAVLLRMNLGPVALFLYAAATTRNTVASFVQLVGWVWSFNRRLTGLTMANGTATPAAGAHDNSNQKEEANDCTYHEKGQFLLLLGDEKHGFTHD